MKIEFETSTIGVGDAAALIMLLGTVCPGALQAMENITESLTLRVGDLEAVRAAADNSYAPPAPDAAAAFASAPPAALPGDEVEDDGEHVVETVNLAPVTTGPTDSRGFPWDDRIHSTVAGGGGAQTEKGVWRAKRGVSKDLVAKVEAEYRSRQGGASPAPSAAPPPPAPAFVPPAPSASPAPPASSPAPLAPGAPPPPASPPPPAPPPPAAAVSSPALTVLFQKIAKAQGLTPQLITHAEVLGAVQRVGLETIAQLAANPDKIPAVEAEMDAWIAHRGGFPA